MTEIKNIDDFIYWSELNFYPLNDWKRFRVDIYLRVQLQNEIFGKGNKPQVNEKYYRYCYEVKPQVCEECCRPLENYSAVNVSHILTKGAHPEMAKDPRNSHLLCFHHHEQAEHEITHVKMKIWQIDQHIIRMLKEDYQKL